MHNQRRRKKRHTHGLKTVEVTRGKSGYGFTISGQQPCILSCIVSGSPADRCGLKTGDYLISVNNLSVAKASHDDVVRLIGSSSGTLSLVIAENCNDSDSSDDDYQARPKNKYPNRARLRQQGKGGAENLVGNGFGRERMDNARSRHSSSGVTSKKGAVAIRSRALSPVVERFGRDPQDPAVGSHHRAQHHHQVVAPSRGLENMDPLSVAVYPRRQKHLSAGGAIGGRAGASQGTKHTIITREMRMTKSQSNPDGLSSDFHSMRPPPAPQHQQQSSMTAKDLSNILYPSIKPHVAAETESPEADDPTPPNIRIIVGYIGSVELPRDAHLPSSRLTSIRSAVRRLRVEHRINTLVLMEVFIGGIRLKNTRGNFVALYAAEKVAFSGTCPDDKRFFGIVTLHGASCSEAVGDAQDDFMMGSSCHVFMVDPDMAIHSVHVHKAVSFGIQCTLDPDTQLCLEFPHSASNVVQNIGKLYQDRNGGFYDADLELQNGGGNPQRGARANESNSSNSDSGLGFGREEVNNDRVYVVEMPSANVSQATVGVASSSQDSSLNWTSDHSALQSLVDTSLYRSTGESDLSNLLPAVRYPGSGASDPSPNTSSNINTSNSSNDVSGHLLTQNTLDRLNLRAMPDPRGIQQQRCHLVDGLDKQNSADNLRRSMHRFLQTQTQTQTRHFEPQSGSDADSLRSSESSQSGGINSNVSVVNSKGKTTKSQGVTAAQGGPKHDHDVPEGTSKHKLSPRVFQPGSQAIVDINRGFIPPAPVTEKPPVPERRPILPPKSYPHAKTPVRDRPLPERPKSTPPFRCHIDVPPLATDEEYDSDPGSVMGMATEEDWNGKIADAPEETPEKRRFSEGVFRKKEREKEAENSRLAKGGSFKQIKTKRRPTISNSHESLVVSDVEFPPKKLNGAPSVNDVLNHPSRTGPESGSAQFGRAAVWAVSFDRLLGDGIGLATFTEFLKKEFSQENIEFWIKCHQYQDISDVDKRKVAAHDLYERHLSPNASDPVNVDAKARTVVENGLGAADVSLFDVAQAQIFQLMKQDSYPRFCKCDLYKQCVVAEMEGKPLPFQNEAPVDKLLKEEKKSIKKTKSSSATDEGGDEKRRKSLLPWRNKSEKRIQKVTTDPDLQRWTRKNEDGTVRVGVGSLDLVDLSVMSKELGSPKKEEDGKEENGNKDGKFCRVILPDGSTTVIPAKTGTPIRSALQRLCERRTLCLSTIEVFQHGSDKPLDLTKEMATLGTKEIKMEQRVLFQIDLPNRKSLVVRAKGSKSLREALKPVLNKYNYKLDSMVIHMAGTGVLVDGDSAASDIEGQRVLVQTMEDFAEWGGFGSHRGLHGKPPLPARSKSSASLTNAESTDDVSNNLIKDIMDGKGDHAHLFDDLGIYDPEKKVEDKGRNEESRNSGLFGFIRRNSLGEKDGAKLKAKVRVFSSQRNTAPSGGLHESDKPKPRPRAKLKDPEEERFIELLTRVQSHRLDDQRGLTRDQLELPDFLKINKGSDAGPNSGLLSPRTRERRNSDSSLLDVDVSRRISRSLSQEKLNGDVVQRSADLYGSPVSNRIPYMDQSFSHDGVVPAYHDAEQVFSHARNYPGSPDLNKSWHAATGHDKFNNNMANLKTPIKNMQGKLSPRVHTPDLIKQRPVRNSNFVKFDSNRLNDINYAGKDDDLDLSVRPLSPVSTSEHLPPPPPPGVTEVNLNGEIANYPPPTPLIGQRDVHQNGAVPNRRHYSQAPKPPPRRTLTTPKKFVPLSPLAHKNVVNVGHNHTHQTSTSSELSQAESTATNRSLSPVSTPSPTTHDLILEAESSPDSGSSGKHKTKPTPPPRPSKRATCGSGSSTDEGSRQVKKTLTYDQKAEADQSENTDMQVSYV